MKKEHIGENTMNSKSATDWEKLRNLSDEEIHAAAVDDPDAQPTDEEFWLNAKIVLPEPKETITIRLDSEVLKWFREEGKGYQTRINSILCAYVKAKENLKHQNH
jgi:uncharacterized protein (DUF4415 family)